MAAYTNLIQWFTRKNSLNRLSSGSYPWPSGETTTRPDLLSSYQLKKYGKFLAAEHSHTGLGAPHLLLERLKENESILRDVRELLLEAVTENRSITPAGEWLLDNFYLVIEQIRTTQKHLPERYGQQLPCLLDGPLKGLPRVFAIAWEMVARADGRVDSESLSGFIGAYQSVTSLTLGEIWAIPIMLRLALIENLRQEGEYLQVAQRGRMDADRWADKLIEINEKDPKSLILIMADMVRAEPDLSISFVSEFSSRLKGQNINITIPMAWVEQCLGEHGQNVERMVHQESQQLASRQVSMSNSISSLRFLDSMDWREFVETVSSVEQVLRGDPPGLYGRMTFTTKDRYRHVVEYLARHSAQSEDEVAGAALGLAQESALEKGLDSFTSHVGFYLVDKGREALEKRLAVSLPFKPRFRRVIHRFPLLFYLGGIALITGILGFYLARHVQIELMPWYAEIIFWILALMSLSQLAVGMVNWFVTVFERPHPLPRLDYSKGIPPEARSLVVIPTMLSSPEAVDKLIHGLEVRFLANRDENLLFALLTDFNDAPQENMPGDDELVDRARKGIEALNEAYVGSKLALTFFLLHRPRAYNPKEGVWLGHERKRGKLAALNQLILNGNTDDFSLIIGEVGLLRNVRYVITLDTDTQLPRDTAHQLVGTIHHPLNRAVYCPEKQRVVEGYGILQPRASISMSTGGKSRYQQLFGNDYGIDPYTRAVSDVYQDLFYEGSFIGKGIYDVAVFEQALAGRFPDNKVLSHDLLEGCYARCALVSDVQVFEEFPLQYGADIKRRHRWVRGDWQISRWLLPRVPGKERRHKNPLTGLSLWKIFDNLRRSLMPVCLTGMLLMGWSYLPSPWLWTAAVIGIMVTPALLSSILDLFLKPKDNLFSQHIYAVMNNTLRRFAQVLYNFICLPYEAIVNLDAILRTIWRMRASKKHMLEWTTSSQVESAFKSGFFSYLKQMWPASAISAVAMVYLFIARPEGLLWAAALLALWLASPLVAWRMSSALPPKKVHLSRKQRIFLRKTARKIWSFFEDFVRAEDNWLPPDNYQEHPAGRVAHRTSPTNIGLSLLSNLTACDFGYITPGHCIERLNNTFDTLNRMERYRGHLYNWYDTQTLIPLYPLYISSVDSGNFAGHLLTLHSGLEEIVARPVFEKSFFDGLTDTWGIILDNIKGGVPPYLQRWRKQLGSICENLDSLSPYELKLRLDMTLGASEKLLNDLRNDGDESVIHWGERLVKQCRDVLEDFCFMLPWTAEPDFEEMRQNTAELPPLKAVPTLLELGGLNSRLVAEMREREVAGTATADQLASWKKLLGHIHVASQRAKGRLQAVERLKGDTLEFARIDFDFLFDKSRSLLTIGYNASDRRRDDGCYDLLASEARLGVFIGIAQGQLPQEAWFCLGRLLAKVSGGPCLISWSGSMFEYLMPLLVMPMYENTLLDQTCHMAVRRQIEYGSRNGIPWGISESGYRMFDSQLNYQYRAFGVPGLGLKRGLADDMVIAPYATIMALMVEPEAAVRNLELLDHDGFSGNYGFYEAVDYTTSRLPRGKTRSVIRSFMAHHQGMSFLSLAYALLDQPMQKRFCRDPEIEAALLLLQEQTPRAVKSYSHVDEMAVTGISAAEERPSVDPAVYGVDTPYPAVHMLSNGSYQVMITNTGGGYSRWRDLAITRWREDTTRDNWGSFCYVCDVDSGEYWSPTHQPSLKPLDNYSAIFQEGKAEYRSKHKDFSMHLEVSVSPEDDLELRRLRIMNLSREPKTIEITSYAEVVLTPPAADPLHPAFSNLFVQTELVNSEQAILCTRRKRSDDEHPPYMVHLMAVHGLPRQEVSYETDRLRFIGRGRSTQNPAAMDKAGPLSNTMGSVLDPIVAVRHRIILAPRKACLVSIVTGMSETREKCLTVAEKYQDKRFSDRLFDLAHTHSQVALSQLGASEADAMLYRKLAAHIIYANPLMRADSETIARNWRGQSSLWGYSISGDLPIMLMRIADPDNINMVRQLIQAQSYWRRKGLYVDLVVWTEDYAGYRQPLQEQIMGMIAASGEGIGNERTGTVVVRPADQLPPEDRILMQSVARIILSDNRGSILEQLERTPAAGAYVPTLTPRQTYAPPALPAPQEAPAELLFNNGLGGFTPDGKEYVIILNESSATPAPWSNVLAGPEFGCVISESGQSYTWSENAHEFRLTPWHNDPITDLGGELFYLRDEETGHYWSPTALPCRGIGTYETRHGFGYSTFSHTESGIASEMTVYSDLESPVKYVRIRLHNLSGRSRLISATGYVEWVLGDVRHKGAQHIVTEYNPEAAGIFARNPYNTEFPGRVAFFCSNADHVSYTGDRSEFLGRNGSQRDPACLKKTHLSQNVGAGLDPCAALQAPIPLTPDEKQEIVFMLGSALTAEEAVNLAKQVRGPEAATKALERVCEFWGNLLGAVQVKTPDPAFDVMFNGWLLYQSLSSRIWGRSGYYQSGGAFGYRDQLQDAMNFVHASPQLLREHILLCASRQFLEGDVQHWWHPPQGRGVRTRCSDDYLWLPMAVCRYVLCTGDMDILDEKVPFLEGAPLAEGQESVYDHPRVSDQTQSLYDHCVRALSNGLPRGDNGLPLMWFGDWNDGMNLIGQHGKGESVWLGFFQYKIFTEFAKLAERYGDTDFALRCSQEATALQNALEENAWDGEWYLRAWFDDGTPVGSAKSEECKIDSLAQSWSVISGAATPERQKTAMDSVDRYLVDREDKLIQLFDPPFDKTSHNPGYIKGYVPGVRENGGQYTHAAVWAVMAFAQMGNSRRAWELLSLLNPVTHGKDAAIVDLYKVEPYVVTADVYSQPPHKGRGGWSWYTGAAGWMYRLMLEDMLGIQLRDGELEFKPCLPEGWGEVSITYQRDGKTYKIILQQTGVDGSRETKVSVNGEAR